MSNHYYPVASQEPAAEARFSVQRLRPVPNGLALLAGVFVARIVLNPVFHVFGDEYAVPLFGLVGSMFLELVHRERRIWLLRVLTFAMVTSLVVTPAGLYLVGYLVSGAWQ
ncbi:hypothetical protein OHV05_37640 (plasmid) [Kitasatospora sp. NBC_00070]|uniref:hypothetical protein n=1 Tax=Kitasatospora sp. NBC_00070 TaxID=2975962 RepID=UPI003244E66B